MDRVPELYSFIGMLNIEREESVPRRSELIEDYRFLRAEHS